MQVIKMQCCGNDFCLVEYNSNINYKEFSQKICNRKLGIGADGLIIVKTNPLEVIFYSSQGIKEQMNGNGIRCFSKYCYEKGYKRRNMVECLTQVGRLSVVIESEDPFLCTVNIGTPFYNNQMLFISDGLDSFGRVLKIGSYNVMTYSLSLGAAQTIVFVDSFDDEVIKLACEISEYKIFTRGTNVSFVKIVDKNTMEVKTYEYKIGFTSASGLGCAAGAVAAKRLGFVKNSVKAILELGELEIKVDKKENVTLTGSAKEVFRCEYMED
ncbi:MAG: diaminopimelate epimerase [Acholeplasmatales bacterium]|nr:diaminopimelate epimerase [Acholeplasmatales bacterium]